MKKPITCDDIETAINNGARMSEWEDHSVLFQQCRARYHARVQAEEREVRLRAARLRAVGLTERDYQMEKDFLG